MTKSDYVMLIVALILYQAFATVLVLKSEHFDDHQKLRQVVFIWLIPIIGAILVRMALNAAEHGQKPADRSLEAQKPGTGDEAPPPAGPDARP